MRACFYFRGDEMLHIGITLGSERKDSLLAFLSDDALHELEILIYRFFVRICYTKINAYSHKL